MLLASGDLDVIAQVTVGMQAMVYPKSVNGAAPVVSAIAVLGMGASTAENHPGGGTYTRLTGTITAIGNGTLTLQTSDGVRTYPLASQVSIRLAGGVRGTISQVPTDVPAIVYLRSDENGTLLVGIIVGGAEAAPTASPTQGTTPSYGTVTRLTGTITAIGNGALTIQAENGVKTYAIAPPVSVILANRHAGTLDQVTVGTAVRFYVRGLDGSAPIVIGIIIV